MGRSSGTSSQNQNRESRLKNPDIDESNDRTKRHGDRSSHRQRHRRDDNREDEEGRPQRRSHDSGDEKYGSKHSSSRNRRRDDRNSKRPKKERENVHDDRYKKREKERHRKHPRRYSDDDNESRSLQLDDSRDDKRRKRHRDINDDKQRKRRKRMHHSHRDRDQKELPRETTKLHVNKSDLFPLGDKLGHPPDTRLDPENDYFEQNHRLRLYLYRECGLTFDDLSSDEARKAFHEFVQRYNAGELEMGYYSATLPLEAVEQCPLTRHQWSLKLSNQDSQNLQLVQMGIRKQTEYQAKGSADTAENASNALQLRDSVSTRANPTSMLTTDVVGPGPDRSKGRTRDRRLREESQFVMEEFTGGPAEGRERLIEKRQERASQIHGASKYAPEVELDDAALYGGGSSDDFRRALAASQKRAAAQEAKKQARIEELQQKEAGKKSAMLQMLGLSHKIGLSKIEIPSRNDPPES
jgi:hypothetical protein